MLAEWTNEWRIYIIILQSQSPKVLYFSQRPNVKGLHFSCLESCSLTYLCSPYHRRCLRHPKPSEMRPTFFSSGNVMALRTTSHQWPSQSCSLPHRNKNWYTWQEGNPLSLTFRYWKPSLDSGVYLLVKSWQSIYTMYMEESNPLLLVTCWACAEPLRFQMNVYSLCKRVSKM